VATTSTVPTAKAALVSLIGTALSGVQVTYGRPSDAELDRECVWVGDVTGRQQVPTMKAGRKARHETYSVEVVAWVAMDRGLVSDAEARAFVLLGSVEDVVANDPTLGIATGTAYFGATTGDFDSAADLIGGPAAVVRLNVDCTARLS
jgi:hypothetical protein